MLTATIESSFDAAHFLPEYDGSCSRLHGHTWRLEVTVKKNKNFESKYPGMVIDFKDLKSVVNRIIDELDHTLINDTIVIPLAENIVLYIVDELKMIMENMLVKVQLWETPTSSITWIKG